MKSAVVDTGRRRESDISKETIKEAQLGMAFPLAKIITLSLGDEKQKRGAKRMFASLLGTLRFGTLPIIIITDLFQNL